MKLSKKGLLMTVPLLVFMDLLSKYFIKKYLVAGVSHPVLGNFIRFTYIENSGMAFGFFSHLSHRYFLIKNVLLIASVMTILFLLIQEIRKEKNILILTGLIFVLSGALGNLLERIFGHLIYNQHWKLIYGQVVDFIDVGFGSYRWFIFNLADSFVSIGLFILVLGFYKYRER